MQDKKLEKNDLVEIEYTGKVKDGEVFDTNIEEEIKKLNLSIKPKILVICLGQNMILPAIDEFLIGKPIGSYTLNLESEKAFGLRRKELMKIMPLSVFKNSERKPEKGMVFSFDNLIGKITAVSGGRIIVDFNNPMAGRDVVYELRVKRILEKKEEKVKALISIFFNREFSFEIENNKLIIRAEKSFFEFISFFKQKFKEILNLDLEVKEAEEKVEEAEEKKKENIEKEKKEQNQT